MGKDFEVKEEASSMKIIKQTYLRQADVIKNSDELSGRKGKTNLI